MKGHRRDMSAARRWGEGLASPRSVLAVWLLLGAGCASVPPTPEIVYRSITVPHVCAPTSDSPAFQKCKADCPDGDAMIWENKSDTFCICRKPPEGT